MVYETVVETEEGLVAASTIADMSRYLPTDRAINDLIMYCVRTGQWSGIRALPVNATAAISMLYYLLCKSSLASETVFRDNMYHNETYLF